MSFKRSPCCGEEPEKPYVPKLRSIPEILHPAPPWSGIAVVDTKLQDLTLQSFKGKYLVLLFYPYDFTFICPTELIQFNDRINEFHDIGADIVATSTESQYTHYAWTTIPRKQGGLGEMKIPVLADKNHRISRDYGILDESEGVPLRALFIIDQKQVLRHVTINEIAVSRSVDEVLRLIQACQFVDKYGDICPIGPKHRKSSADEPNFFDTT